MPRGVGLGKGGWEMRGDRVAVLRLVCERYGARVGRVGFKSLIDDSLLNAKRSDVATTAGSTVAALMTIIRHGPPGCPMVSSPYGSVSRVDIGSEPCLERLCIVHACERC